MTEPATDEQRRRLEELRRRGASDASSKTPGRRAAKRHAAAGSRIAVAGAGLTAMFGLVAVMAYAGRQAEAGTVPPSIAPGPRVVVVLHYVGGSTPPTGSGTVVQGPASGPVVLTARPSVQAAAPAGQVAKTHGSR